MTKLHRADANENNVSSGSEFGSTILLMMACYSSLSVICVYLSLQLRLQEQWQDISYLNLALEDALQSRFSHVVDR